MKAEATGLMNIKNTLKQLLHSDCTHDCDQGRNCTCVHKVSSASDAFPPPSDKGDIMSKHFVNLEKVNYNFTVTRCDNGFMLEVNGRTTDGDWSTARILCLDEKSLFEAITELNKKQLDD